MNRKILFWSAIFAISMGFFESAVVVYLRALSQPGGFVFPIPELPSLIEKTEFLREFFSLLMLAAVACLLEKRFMGRFAWFIFNFAIWDLFYYLFLWLLIGWPGSLLTHDLLFLIPVPWTAPVLAPMLLSLLMIALALLVFTHSQKIHYLKFKGNELLFLIVGSLLCLLSFMYDPIFFPEKITGASYQPSAFNWYLFGAGFLLILSGVVLFHIQKKRTKR